VDGDADGGRIVAGGSDHLLTTISVIFWLREGARAESWQGRYGYIVELGAASVQFLSADTESNVVGATASLLLEIDEAQDVAEEKYLRDFPADGRDNERHHRVVWRVNVLWDAPSNPA